MDIVSRLPHDLNTRLKAVTTYQRNRCSVRYITRMYHVSKASLMRWVKSYDGTRESLQDKSHRPLTPNPNRHTDEEIKKIRDMIRRNPDIGLNELYSKLRLSVGYSRHYTSLYRLLRRLGVYGPSRVKKKFYIPKKYDTPKLLGEKMQLDVKYVPGECRASNLLDDQRFYQYTIIDEASRERFIYPYKEQSSYSTVDFVKRAIAYFGYVPKIIQTDNGFEFTHPREVKEIHPFDQLCNSLGIIHKKIKPRTPRHNGKVERSHRNDNERFYKTLKFFSYDDLIKQMKVYLKRSNSILMRTLNWKNPIQMRQQLIEENLIGYQS